MELSYIGILIKTYSPFLSLKGLSETACLRWKKYVFLFLKKKQQTVLYMYNL